MYNEIQKKRYIDIRNQEVILGYNYLENIFNKTQAIEERIGKDVSCFTIKEILDLYKADINVKSIDVLTNINSQLSLYTQWCISQNLVPTGINNYQEISVDIISSCVNRLAMENSIFTREAILDIANNMRNKREKFVLLMLFETGKAKHYSTIFNAKISDIDKAKGIMNLSDGRIVSVSKELIKYAEQADQEFVYYSYGTQDIKRGVERELEDTDYIYKELSNTLVYDIQHKVVRLGKSMRKAMQLAGVSNWTKLNSIAESGTIYQIHELAERHNISTKEVINNKNLKEIVEYQHSVSIRPVVFMRKFEDYL